MKNNLITPFFILLSLLILITDSNAQIAEDLFKGLEYRMIGPTRGGRVSTVTGVPGELFTFYMGTTGGGVWKTTDGGLSWQNISDGFIKAGSIGAIAIAPSDPNVIYVGTGSPDPRGNVSAGIGVYRSTDAGETWTFIGLKNIGQTGQIVIHPDDPDEVWVGALGNIFGPNSERGVYHSKNGGKDWTKSLFVSDKTGCIDLAIDPNNPRILFAGMWTAERKPWTIIDGSDEGGLWKSTDGGLTWKKLKNGLPEGVVGRIGISISPANSKKIYVVQEALDEKKGGVYRSDDGGKSFKRINRNHSLRQRAWYYNRIIADPQDENTVYLTNVSFFKSIDGGKSFQRIRTPHSDHHAHWVNPDHPNIMINGNDGGGCITFNGGKTWTTQNNQPTAEFYRVSVDNQFPYRVYGAQQDNSTMSVASRTTEGLTTTSDWYAVGGGESGHIAVDPRNPDLIYAGTYIGVITKKDRSSGFQANINAYPQMHDGQAPRDIKYRFQWNAPIRISPHNPDVVYHCSQYVHRTKDGGNTWKVISPDLTTNKDEYQNIPGGPIQHDHTGVELYTTIFAFEESPQIPGELWAGTDDGRLHISRNDGGNWQEITPEGMPAEGTINTIELSNHKAGRAFVAVYKYRDNDFRPYIFMTDNYGKKWKRLTNGQNGIPNDHFVRVVREDPIRKGLLYAGTEFGMYISFNEGDNWQPFQLKLPITPITDMLIKDNDLVLATQGRSFYILDDLSPLRTIQKDMADQDVHLFQPIDAIRYQAVFGRTEAERRPYGAFIYYTLKEKPSDDTILKLSIIDSEGTTRRVFSTKPDKEKKEESLKAQKGLNRFVWNLKYEPLEKQKGSFFSLANTGGIKAPTGQHIIQLELGDKKMSQSFQIKKDPRWSQTDADLKAQYQLALDIKSLFNKSHAAIGDLRSLRVQIKDRMGLMKNKSYASSLSETGKSINKELTQLEKQLIQTKNESGQDPINYPSMIDDQIAYLYSVVNAMENRPGQGAYDRFNDLKTAMNQHFDQLKAIKEKVAKFNDDLSTAGVRIIMEED